MKVRIDEDEPGGTVFAAMFGATRETYLRVDRRTADDPAKVPFAKGETAWWTSEGKNHRVVNGRIERDFEREALFVELPDLAVLEPLIRAGMRITISGRVGDLTKDGIPMLTVES